MCQISNANGVRHTFIVIRTVLLSDMGVMVGRDNREQSDEQSTNQSTTYQRTMNPQAPTNRRTVLKLLGVSAVGSVALSGSASAKPPATPPFWTPTWGSDETDDWEIMDVSGSVEREKTKPIALIPTTAIGKDSFLGQGSHFPGGHDQVVDTPPRNHGKFNVNWHTHNVFYTGGGEHHNRPYNGKEVLTNSYEVVKDTFDWLLGTKKVEDIRDPNLTTVTPNDAPSGSDDYLNTISQIEGATYANSVGDPSKVPKSSVGGDLLFPTDEQALPDGTTYGQIFGEGLFVAFTFVCPVRPTDSND